jgi:LysM repeat protein
MTIRFRLGGKTIHVSNTPPRAPGADLRRQKLTSEEMDGLRQMLSEDQGGTEVKLAGAALLEAVAQRIADGRWTQTVIGNSMLLGGTGAGIAATATETEAPTKATSKLSTDKKTWVEVELLDLNKRPVKGAKVELKLPDGTTNVATLSGDGTIRVNNIDPGTCTVTFPDLDGREWKRSGDIASGAAVELFSGPPKIPMGSYTVKQGDYIASIAQDAGFVSWKTVWEDGKNAALRDKRNPNVLYPGDVVQIPLRQRKEESISTTERTTFETIGDPITVKLVVLGWDGTPISSTDVQFKIDSPETCKTAEDGSAKKNVRPNGPKEGDLVVKGFTMPLKLGHLDPVEEFTGQVWRLNNLGYRAGSPADAQDINFRSAVEEFQCDNSLSVDGVCGPQTQEKLRSVHGS